MPMKPAQVCTVPGCRGTAKKFGRCEIHSRVHEREVHPNRTFYNSRLWQAVRENKLSDYPICEECERDERISPASEVDHITPLSSGGAQLDRSNLQSLCKPCHSAKTRREVFA